MGHQPARRRALVVVASGRSVPRRPWGTTNRCSRASSRMCGGAWAQPSGLVTGSSIDSGRMNLGWRPQPSVRGDVDAGV